MKNGMKKWGSFFAFITIMIITGMTGHAQATEKKEALNPEALFQAFAGTWTINARINAMGKMFHKIGIVTFTKTGPTSITFNSAEHGALPVPGHKGDKFDTETGKFWWDAKRKKIAKTEIEPGKEPKIDYYDLFNLGYGGKPEMSEGITELGITEPVTRPFRFVVFDHDTIIWTGSIVNAKGVDLLNATAILKRME